MVRRYIDGCIESIQMVAYALVAFLALVMWAVLLAAPRCVALGGLFTSRPIWLLALLGYFVTIPIASVIGRRFGI